MNREEIQKYSYTDTGNSLCLNIDYVKYEDHKQIIDSQEQTIGKLRKVISVEQTLKKFDAQTIATLEKQCSILKEEIDSMKCCGNCGIRNATRSFNPECVACIRGVHLVSNAEKKDNWIKR